MKKFSHKYFLSILFFLALQQIDTNAIAQCAMCKATIESNVSDGSQKVGAGLNTGILFLMTVPYVLLVLLMWYFFRDKIKGAVKSFKSVYPKIN